MLLLMERKHWGQHDDDCFACRIQSVSLGYTHGRDNFHGATIRERQRKIVDEGRANGADPIPTTRWV